MSIPAQVANCWEGQLRVEGVLHQMGLDSMSSCTSCPGSPRDEKLSYLDFARKARSKQRNMGEYTYGHRACSSEVLPSPPAPAILFSADNM